MQPYDESFFATCQDESGKSASQVVPLIVELLSPESVVDVGCGIGTWLLEFQKCGVEKILGIDGSYVNRDQLLIPQSNFIPYDLTTPLLLPPNTAGTYDLAVSLEVAEHLPESSAEIFVKSLVSLAPTILFSAAIPYQGGTHHINEQWPNYWATHFLAHGYVAVDWIRPQIINKPGIAYYYAQNSLLFIQETRLASWPDLQNYVVAADDLALCRVHPTIWMKVNDPRSQPIRKVLTSLPFSLKNIITRRLGRVRSKK